MNGVAQANGQSPEKLASPLRHEEAAVEANGAGDANGHDGCSDEEDDERAELEAEVEHLVADKTYHDFIQHVVQHKEIPDEDATTDGDFVVDLPEPVAKQVDEDEEEDQDVDSDSTLTDGEEFEDAQENLDQETKIPKEALVEAQKRFPNFWRFKHAMNTEYREGDYAEEQDPDYEPEKDTDAVNLDDSQDEAAIADVSVNSGNALPDSTTGGGEDEEWRQTEEVEINSDQEKEDDSEDEDVMKAELTELNAERDRDLKHDVDGLVEMVEYMTVVVSEEGAQAAAEAAAGTEANEETEEMEDEDQGQTILELDVEGYVSGEDPDFAVGEEVLDAASDSDINTDDEGGAGDKME